MDGSSFDKLSVSVHRLREQATRRNALRLLAGGAAVAVTGAIATETDAKKKKNKKYNKYKKCKNNFYGGFCNGNKDCCNGSCRNGICYYNGGGGGGNNGGCGGVSCPNGWSCRKQGPAHICSPYNYPNYCGNNTYWNGNYNCCNGGYGGIACPGGRECCGIATCCQAGWRCCGNVCIPNNNNFNCNDFYQNAEIGSESIPTMEPTAPDANDSFVFDPETAG